MSRNLEWKNLMNNPGQGQPSLVMLLIHILIKKDNIVIQHV